MFFPRATHRFATSFFPINTARRPGWDVTIVPSIIRPEISDRQLLARSNHGVPSVLLYVSPYGSMRQTLWELLTVCRNVNLTRDYRVDVFAPAEKLAEVSFGTT